MKLFSVGVDISKEAYAMAVERMDQLKGESDEKDKQSAVS